MRLIALLSVFAMAGCATITTAHNYHGVNVEGGEVPIESVVIENTGWKIFDLIPIGGGDPQRPNSCSCRLFEDTTSLQHCHCRYPLRRATRSGLLLLGGHQSDCPFGGAADVHGGTYQN